MNKVNDILEELKNIGSNLGDLPREMPYKTPAGYFENLSASTLQLIKDINEKENIPAWSKKMPLDVPGNYFEGLAAQVISNVNSKNVLPGLPASQPLQVPAGYFDALPAQMLAAAKASETTKKETWAIPLRRVYSLRSVRWAAAAIFLFFIGIGGVFYFQRPVPETDKLLAAVPKNDIVDYLQGTYRIDVDRVINTNVNNLQVDNKAIVEYLNETGWDITE